MIAQPSTVIGQKFAIRRDLRAVRRTLARIKNSVQLAELAEFGRRTPAQMADCLHRRRHDRSPTEMPIYVTPAAFDGTQAELAEGKETEMLAMTRDASLRGVGFLHGEPLEGNHAIVSVDLLDGYPISLLLVLRWSNIERSGAYMSGGRFLGIAEAAVF